MTVSNTAKIVLFGAAVLSSNMTVHAWGADRGRGLTRGFFVGGFPTGGAESLEPDFTEIQVFLGLPPGRYIANASAVLASSDLEIHSVDCTFTIQGIFQGELIRGMIGGTINNFVTLPLTTGFKISEPQDIGVSCRGPGGRIVVSQPSPMTLIRVDRLSVQGDVVTELPDGAEVSGEFEEEEPVR